MKSIIFVFALIAAVSCDVSHVVQGDGWYKDESGYHYNEPAVQLNENVVEEAIVPAEEPAPIITEVVAEPVIVAEPEQVIVEEIVEVVVPEEPAPVVDAAPKVTNEYLPPSNDYLPPQSADAKKKRQIPVRKVYRRFVKKH